MSFRNPREKLIWQIVFAVLTAAFVALGISILILISRPDVDSFYALAFGGAGMALLGFPALSLLIALLNDRKN